MNTLIIQWLLKPNSSCNLQLWNNEQQIIWQEHAVAADCLGELIKNNSPSKNSRIIVLFPGQWVTISEVSLPKRISNKQRQQMIGFAIEEELIDDPSSLHFVLASPKELPKGDKLTKAKKTQVYPVAIVSQEKMTAVTAELEKQGIFPDSIIPDYHAINTPESEQNADENISTYSVSIINEEAFIRTSAAQGYSIDSKQLPWFCQQLYLQNSTDENPPTTSIKLNIDADDLPWEWPEDLIATMPLEAVMGCPLEKCWSFTAMIKPQINLLSGKYRSRGKYRRKRDKEKGSIWRKCAYTAILFLIVAFASKGARYNILSTENHMYMQQASAEINEYSTKANISSPSDIKKQVQRLLMEIKKLDGHNIVLNQLITLDDLLSTNPQAKILALDYKKNSWEMIMQANSPDILKNVTAELIKANWKATSRPASDKLKSSFNVAPEGKDNNSNTAVISILEISHNQQPVIKEKQS